MTGPLYLRRFHNTVRTLATPAAFLGVEGASPRLLFLSPHDDDAVIAAGAFMAAAADSGASVFVAVLTDGAQGYTHAAERESIAAIRARESAECYKGLGVVETVNLGFADNDLTRFVGRRFAAPDDPGALHGATGIENALVHLLRRVRPDAVFAPHRADPHPDHRILADESPISLFHASGPLWPELGTPLPRIPTLFHYTVYSPFATPPDRRFVPAAEHAKAKAEALTAFASQGPVIERLLVELKEGAAPEHFREAPLKLQRPGDYDDLFAV